MVVMCVLILVRFTYSRRAECLMQPYQAMVKRGATERDIRAHSGIPQAVVVGPRGLRDWMRNYPPTERTPPFRGRALIYYLGSPGMDSDVVYVFLTPQGRAFAVVRGAG